MGPPLKPERALLLQAFHVPMYPSGPDCSRLDLDGPPLKPRRALLVQAWTRLFPNGPEWALHSPSGPCYSRLFICVYWVPVFLNGPDCSRMDPDGPAT